MCNDPTDKSSVSRVILDGLAIVHMIPHGDAKTFDEYAERFANIVLNEWEAVNRIDICNIYIDLTV